MKRLWDKFLVQKYTQLLLILILIFLGFSISNAAISEITLSVLVVTAIILVIRTFYIHERLYKLYMAIAFLAFVADGFEIYLSTVHPINIPLGLTTNLVHLMFFGLAVALIAQQIFLGQVVTLDTIVGGICLFLLIGDIWFLMYHSLYLINSDAFNYGNNQLEPFDLLYFSFTTLTTVGYGDLSPLSPLANAATNLEGIIGVLYPAIFIGRLVGAYQPISAKRS